jgi:hypothetical protein
VDVAVDWDGSGRVWTCGKEGAVRCWDSRVFGGVGMEIGKGGKGLRGLSLTCAGHIGLGKGRKRILNETSTLYCFQLPEEGLLPCSR